jgi:hypothetical protein
MKKFMTAGIAAVALAALVIGGAFAFTGNDGKDRDGKKLPSDRKAVEAPIDGLDVFVLESFPPQYVVNVQAGLPSGCAEAYRHKVSRDGNVITIDVLNTMPADDDVVCTMIYGTYELNINLGSDFESGETYTVQVNDQEIEFVAQ